MIRIPIIISFLILNLSICFSQVTDDIYTIPEILNSNKGFKIIAKSATPHIGYRLNKSSNIIGDTIFINACYFIGLQASPAKFSDTFEVKALNPGNYIIKFEHTLSWDTGSCVKWRNEILTKSIHILDATSAFSGDIPFTSRFYPNPVTNILHFENIKISRIKILNLTGQVVIDKQIVQGVNVIDVSNLEKGIYIVENTDLLGKISRVKIIK